jgi:hypothetical protein
MFWKRRSTFPEKRLVSDRRELHLVDGDIDALTRTVRSGGQVPPPAGLRSEEWRRRQEDAEEAELLPDWFPRADRDGEAPVRSERGFVRDERFVDYMASSFQTAPQERVDEHDAPGDRKWILVGLAAIVLLLILLGRHWLYAR